MARGHRGHPLPVRLGRVLLADLLVGLAYGAAFFVAIAPFFVAEVRGASWYWQLAGAGLGLAAVFAVSSQAKALGRRFRRQIGWLEETYALAKARRDASAKLNELSVTEQIVFTLLFAPAVFAIFFPTVPFVRWAYSNLEWIDSVGGTLVLLAPMMLLMPLMMVSMRLATYAAVHVVASLTGFSH